MKKLFIGLFVGFVLILVGSTVTKPQIAVGAFSPTGGGTYRLQSSVGTSNTTIRLSSFKEPVSNIPYTMSYLGSSIGYGTLSPQSSISEFVSFSGITQNSDGTATLTGVARGLTRTPAGNFCTASTTLAQAHSGQSIFILSDSPCLFAEYTPLRNPATSTAVLVFTSTAPPRLDTPGLQASGTYNATTSEFATIAYVLTTTLSGASNATESVKGIVELATQLEQAASQILGSTGAGLVLQARYATSTPVTGLAGNDVVVTNTSGFINPLFMATSSVQAPNGYLWTASTTFLGATTTSFGLMTLNWNGLPFTIPPTRAASSTVLSENGSGGLTFEVPDVRTLLSDGATYSTSATATSTLKTLVIPANTLGANDQIYIRTHFGRTAGTANAIRFSIAFGTGLATSTIINSANLASGQTLEGSRGEVTINGRNSATSQADYGTVLGNDGATGFGSVLFASSTQSTVNIANQSYISFSAMVVNGGDTAAYEGIYVQVIRGK